MRKRTRPNGQKRVPDARKDAKRTRRQADDVGNGTDALPTEVLHSILHRAGRAARLVSRRWHTAYGPPTGLYLDRLTTRRDLFALIPRAMPVAAPPNGPLASIRAIFLAPPPAPPYTRPNPFNGAILAALAHRFPVLHTLHLLPTAALAHTQVPLLAPLAPHLTCLMLALDAPTTAATLATTFTRLRSLTVQGTRRCQLPGLLTALTPLLPNLHTLEYHTNSSRSSAAPAVLPTLSTMPHLTRLVVSCLLANWDQASVALLATSWPRLAALHLNLDLASPHEHPSPQPPNRPATADDVLASVVRHTALTSLTLQSLTFHSQPLPYHHLAALPRLSAISIAPLAADDAPPDTSHLPMLPPPGSLVALTRLTLHNIGTPLTDKLLLPLATLVPTLLRFAFSGEVGAFAGLDSLRRFTALQSLHLHHSTWAQQPDDEPLAARECAELVGSSLSHLTSLTLLDRMFRWPVDALVAAVARHGLVRHVSTNRHLPHLAAIMGPASHSLARLQVTLVGADILGLLEALATMVALRSLTINHTYNYGPACDTLQLGPASDTGTVPSAAECSGTAGAGPSTVGTGTGGTAAAGTSTAGAGASTGGRSGRAARQLAGRQPQAHPLLLPPGLRLLCTAGFAARRSAPKGPRWQAVVAAAARQGCELREEPRLAEYDDCNGCLDGAAPKFLRTWGGGARGERAGA